MLFKKLFEPIEIGKVWIKNRIAMAPMNNGHQIDPTQGTITQRCVDYYVERAKGGVGLIITGVFKVENNIERCIKDDIMQWPLLSEKSLPEYIELTDYIHSYGAKIFAQLSAGPGRVTSAKVINSGIKPVSASPNQAYWVPEVTCRALTTEEVSEIVKAFGWAAEIVAKVGMDGIEVHGHEGYLIDQFTTSLWNKRTDKYGGSDIKDRLSFPIEILKEIKNRVGSDFPVIYRYGIKHFIDKSGQASLHGEREIGRDFSESVKMAKLLEEAGYDALDVDTGCYEGNYFAHPPCYQLHGFSIDLVGELKKFVKIPIIAANRMDIPELAEDAIKKEKTDIVALGRALLADAYWPQKVCEGRIEYIRPCIGCQEGCLRRASIGASTSCSVNPACGRETQFTFTTSSKRKRVVIVGGGVAGMEAARIATIKGHYVVLYEKTDKLGGHLIEASVPDFKKDIERLLKWYKIEMNKLEIEIKFNKEANFELIRKEKADIIIIASGSTPLVCKEIPGIDNSIVVTCCDLYLNKNKAGNNVVIVGGGLEGCETALWLAKQGKKVTVIEKLPNVIADTFFANRCMLLDLLAEHKVSIIVNTTVQEITNDGLIIINKNFERSKIDCDTIVLAVGMKPNQELYKSLVGKVPNIYLIGDSKKPRKIHDAIFEGYIIGNTI